MTQTTLPTALLACLGVLLAADGVCAQDLDWAQKMFDQLTVDFGVVARGSDAVKRVQITNPYKQDVHIANVTTTCGCSAAKPSKDLLASRESAYIEITMNTLRFTRRKDSNVIVTFDRPQFREVRIPVTAYIRTDVVLTPGAADFGPVERGQEVQRKLSIAYAGRDDWTIKEVRPGSEHLAAEVVETGRENGRVNYDLFVTLKPSAPLGTFRQQLTLVTDDSRSPFVPVLVEARVESDITVTPSVVSLGMLTPGQTKTVNVVLRGRKPFAIEKIECESDRHAFTVRLPNAEKEKEVHVLPLTVTPPDAPGEFSEEFIVTIAGRQAPLSFKAYGKITQ